MQLETDIFIKNKLATLKSKCRPISNCYSTSVFELANNIWEYQDSFCFTYNDSGVERLVFFSDGEESLAKLINCTPRGRYYIEFLTKNPNEYNEVFREEQLITRLKRVVNPDCSNVFLDEKVMQFEDESVPSFPIKEDAIEINKIMWGTFHTEVSHLLTDKEMVEAIDRGEITIHRNKSGDIDAVLHVVIRPKKFYTNHAINHADKRIINAMFISRLREYYLLGGKYIFCWVPEDNIASLTWNKKYGMIHDGMWNLVYCIER